jgi:hypothetical protein
MNFFIDVLAIILILIALDYKRTNECKFITFEIKDSSLVAALFILACILIDLNI